MADPIESRTASGAASLTRREFVVAGALGSAALLSAVASPGAGPAAARSGPPLENLVPGRVGEWVSAPSQHVLIPTGEKVKDRTYDDLLTRYYVSETRAPVMLLIAYGSAQSGDAQLHRPEVCYPAAGFRLQSWPDSLLAVLGVPIVARSLTAVATGRVEQILYWSRIGRDFPTSSLGQRWSILRQTLGGTVPDGALVRISTIDGDRPRALDRLGHFARSLVGAGGEDLRSILTGRTQRSRG